MNFYLYLRVRVKQCLRSLKRSANFPFSVLPAGGEGGRLACYQQAGRVGQAETERKYVGVRGKRIRYFTPPLILTLSLLSTLILAVS